MRWSWWSATPSACSGSTRRRPRCSACTIPATSAAPLGERLQPLPLAHWLAGGPQCRTDAGRRLAGRSGLRLNLRLIPYSDELWLLVARDVSRLLRLEQMRRDFVANVSHELRTPLTVVHGYLDMLDPDDFPEWAPMLAEMQQAVAAHDPAGRGPADPVAAGGAGQHPR